MTLHVDDGRNFLMMSRKKYDVITADIILPRHAGAGSLYSREYYELVRDRLAEGGLAMQWNGGDSETEYKLLMRTFMSVFPYTTLWGDGSLMLGSMKPFTLSQSAYEARRVALRAVSVGPRDAEADLHRGPRGDSRLRRRRPDPDRRQAGDRVFPVAAKNDAPGGYTGRRAPIEAILTP